MEEIADMIERHQDHHSSPERVNTPHAHGGFPVVLLNLPAG
jgi:hypothetical protein